MRAPCISRRLCHRRACMQRTVEGYVFRDRKIEPRHHRRGGGGGGHSARFACRVARSGMASTQRRPSLRRGRRPGGVEHASLVGTADGWVGRDCLAVADEIEHHAASAVAGYCSASMYCRTKESRSSDCSDRATTKCMHGRETPTRLQ